MKKIYLNLLLIALLVVGASSCKKSYLDTAPSGSYAEGTLANEQSGTEALINGIHGMMYTYGFGQFHGNGIPSLNAQLDMLSDLYINTRPAYYMAVYRWQDHISPYGALNANVWDSFYTIVQHANKVIKLTKEENYPSKEDAARVLGEAYIFRAYSFHYLVQAFSPAYNGKNGSELGIILRLEPTLDPMPRATLKQTFDQINSDLAKGLEYLTIAAKAKKISWEKNRITLPTAYGIGARIAMTQNDFAKAEEYASKSINTSLSSGFASLQKGAELLDGFNDWSSKEWMWAYKQGGDQNQYFAGFAVPYSYNYKSGQKTTYAINRSYFDKMGKDDVRRKWFIARDFMENGELMPLSDVWNLVPDDGAPELFKQKNGKPDWEYTGQQIKFACKSLTGGTFMDVQLMRLSEMYYIMAEAQARQGNVAAAAQTLNVVMKTRDVTYVANETLSADDFAFEILRNKWIDLYGESGVFFDQKRIGHVPNRLASGNNNYLDSTDMPDFYKRNEGENAMTIAKTADAKQWTFAIPYAEIKGNNLCEQNPL